MGTAIRCSHSVAKAGRLWWRLDPKGQRATYSYDAGGRPTLIQYSDGTRVSYSYDAGDNRTQMQDSTGTTTYSYDELDRPKTVTYPANKTITYVYDEVGNRKTMTDPDGGVTTYSYDTRALPSWLVNPHGERTTWVYDDLGRPTTMIHGNLTVAETDYDAAGRTTAVRNLKTDRSVLSIFTYTYDNAGNRTAVQEANGDRVTWSYDELYQLTREQRSGANAYDATYTYDAVGNRLTKLESETIASYSYDAANQLSYEYTPSSRTTYTYDGNGNTEVIDAAGSLTTNTWDVENHLTVVQLPAGGRTTATYDGDGKRRSYNDSVMLRNFIWDGENIVRQTDVNGTTDRRYTLNPQVYGELISQDGPTFHHYDALGSTMQLTDASQDTVISYLYRAFGEQTILSGSNPNRFTWVGRLGYYHQPDSSDYWVRARVYRPAAGRWVSRDPLALSAGVAQDRHSMAFLRGLTGSSLLTPARPRAYVYADNEPIRNADPSGLILPVIAAARALLALGTAAVGTYAAVEAAICLARWWDDYQRYQASPRLCTEYQDRLRREVLTGKDPVLMGCLELAGISASMFLSASLGPKLLRLLGARAAPPGAIWAR